MNDTTIATIDRALEGDASAIAKLDGKTERPRVDFSKQIEEAVRPSVLPLVSPTDKALECRWLIWLSFHRQLAADGNREPSIEDIARVERTLAAFEQAA